MTTLIIQDLPVSEDLDAKRMSAVRGGMHKLSLPYGFPGYGNYAPTNVSFDASQMLGQTQNVVNNNGNNAAFVSGITSTVNPTQTGANTIRFGYY